MRVLRWTRRCVVKVHQVWAAKPNGLTPIKRKGHASQSESRISLNLRYAWLSFVVFGFIPGLSGATSLSELRRLTFRDVRGHHVATLDVRNEGHAGFTLMPPAVT